MAFTQIEEEPARTEAAAYCASLEEDLDLSVKGGCITHRAKENEVERYDNWAHGPHWP